MSQCIALLRGINVGRAKRVPMAELRELVTELGLGNVRTLLNSGNVLFDAPRPDLSKLTAALQRSFTERFGFSAGVTVITAAELVKIIVENPLLAVAQDPSRHLVGFAGDPATFRPLKPMLRQKWAPDALAITKRAAYLWCSAGVLDSPVSKAFSKQAGLGVTTRNWGTVLKLHAAAQGGASRVD
jgi:uncharacterized protein (DUF1697 family)